MINGKKSMTNGNRMYAFLTTRNKIYAQWEQNLYFFNKEVKKYMSNGIKIYAFLTGRKKNIF